MTVERRIILFAQIGRILPRMNLPADYIEIDETWQILTIEAVEPQRVRN